MGFLKVELVDMETCIAKAMEPAQQLSVLLCSTMVRAAVPVSSCGAIETQNGVVPVQLQSRRLTSVLLIMLCQTTMEVGVTLHFNISI